MARSVRKNEMNERNDLFVSGCEVWVRMFGSAGCCVSGSGEPLVLTFSGLMCLVCGCLDPLVV